VAKPITLPGTLRTMFQRLYETSLSQGHSAWNWWAIVLETDATQPEYLQRLLIIRGGCLRLISDLQTLPDDAIDNYTRKIWMGSVGRLLSLTDTTGMHGTFVEWRKRATENDIAALATLDIFYRQQGLHAEVDPENIQALIEEIRELHKRIQRSTLEGRCKGYLLASLDGLRFFLERIDLYGADVVWSATAQAMGSVFRVENEMAATDGTSDDSVSGKDIMATLKKVFEAIRFVGGVSSGSAAIGSAGTFLLEHLSPPTF
jgi:hypothetical protein